MAAGTLVSIGEYLSTSYHPDREYVEGQVVERNVGEYNHGFLQLIIGFALRACGLRTYVETRFKVREDRFRIPDIFALAPGQRRSGRYQTETPYIVVEVLSPDDRIADLNHKIAEYFERGVPNIWVVDPETRSLTVHQPTETHTFTDRVTTADGLVSLDLADIFRQLAEDQAE